MRIRELTLQTRDPAGLAAWYRVTLGLAAAPGAPGGVVAGGSVLRFEPAPAGGADPVYHFAFNVPEDRIEDSLAWIRARATVIEDEDGPIIHYDTWDAHAVYFLDPAGNIGELIARHALRHARSGPFDGAALIELSEVGLPTTDVPGLSAALREGLGVAEYRPGHSKFVPLGDERGLLILVAEGRAWFPTGSIARPFPLRIVHDGPSFEAPGLPYRFLRR